MFKTFIPDSTIPSINASSRGFPDILPSLPTQISSIPKSIHLCEIANPIFFTTSSLI